MKYLILSLLLVCALEASGSAPPAAEEFGYKSGYSTMIRLGRDLYNALKPEAKEVISSQPISFQTDATPYVRLLYYDDEPNPVRGVWVSAGFVDLVNNIAHAKAIDRIQKGYFAKYVELLSAEKGDKPLMRLPNDNNPAFWSEDMLNEQLSNFNSIVGMVVAVKLAHHYLGHYEKYKSQLDPTNLNAPKINNLITPKEWDDAFAQGIRNALDAGCTVEGVAPFLDAFDKMKTRPQWAAFFLPDFAKIPAMKKQMDKIQKKFFANEQ
jgi:hypothetical protein